MTSIPSNGENGLSVIVIGAGISGLAVATGLARKGHQVTVLESDEGLNEFGASIGILANGVRPLTAWGLADVFNKVVTKNKFFEIKNGYTNETLGYLPLNKDNFSVINYGQETWSINRNDYQHVLAEAAEMKGAKILFNARTALVDVDNCIVRTEDGRSFKGDVIIGADGNSSAVRVSIPATSHVKPQPLEEQCFRCTVPKDKMRGNPKLEWLLNVGNEFAWSAPGKYVLTWPLPDHRPYDVVTCIQRPSDVPAGRWGTRASPEEARKDFADFCPEVKELLSHIETAVKWTLCDLPPLKTCRSENGRVVLIGDAFHAMIPHSASGGNSAIEDASCISECLDWAYRNGKDIAMATKAFEDLRKPRVERMQQASHEGYNFLGAKEDFLPIRDQALKDSMEHYDAVFALPEEQRSWPKPEPDMNARFPLEPYIQWLYGYDAIEITKQHLAKLD